MLKIGDRVKVRPRLKDGLVYGGFTFAREMKMYRSCWVTITEIHGISYRIDLDDGRYFWSEEMFTEESVESAKTKVETIKFKVGDRVRVVGPKVIDGRETGVIDDIKNKEGVIVETQRPSALDCGVEFDFDFIEGHDCGGKSKKNRGRYIKSSCLQLIKNEVSGIDNELLEKLTTSIETLSQKVNQEDPFKQAMLEGIIEKGKQLATDDLKEELKKDLDKFIQETYGSIPKKIEIKRETKTKELEGIFHKDFEKICKIVDSNIPLMLVGGAGAGKNYTLEQVAKALDLTFYTTNAVNQDYKLTGFIDANGKYHETEFYKAFVNGGMFFLDEIDASCPEALVTLNSAIANKYFDFPIGRITANENFRIVCAGNTYGTGADMVYVGRNVLDGATLDRFVVLEFDYDDEVEKQLAYDNELYTFIKDLRNAVNQAGLRYIVSMRALINSTKLLEIGIDKNTILKITVIKNMQKDDLNTVIGKLKITTSDWYRELKRLCD